MISPADAALAARDRAIPGLAVVLDAEALAVALRAALPASGVGAAAPFYVRYKPGTSCLVAYSVELPGGPVTVSAHAYAPALRDKLARARRLRERPGALGLAGLVLEGRHIAVYSWPHDRELPALAKLARPKATARLLAELCPRRDDLPRAALVHLRYRPQRRYVGRVTGGAGGDALLKLYCAEDYGPARAAALAFRQEGPLALATPLGWADEPRALLFPWVSGQPLAATLWGEGADAAVRLAGAALATLHGQAAGLPPDALDAPGAGLAAALGALTALCPELEPRLHRLAARLAAGLVALPARSRPLHGDFYADQVLVGPGAATLLDLDNARWGDPAADLGNFVAHLRRAAALGRGSPGRAAELAAALCEGYAEVAPPPRRAQLELYTALGLLRLAPEPFRYRAPDWPARVEAIVAAAERALAGEGAPCAVEGYAQGGRHG